MGELGCSTMKAEELEGESDEDEEVPPPPPQYQWSIWHRFSDEKKKANRIKPVQAGFITSLKDFEAAEETEWSRQALGDLQTHDQIRILKMKPLEEGQDPNDRYDWTKQEELSQRGWCFRITDFKPFGPPMRPRHHRIGAFKDLSPTHTKDILEGGICDSFTAMCRVVITGELRHWDDCNLIDAIVFHRTLHGAYVEVWVPPVGFGEINPLAVEMREAKIEEKKAEAEEAGVEEGDEEEEIDWEAKYPPIELPDPILTSEPIRGQIGRSIKRCLKKHANLSPDEYSLNVRGCDEFYGHKFDSDKGIWINPTKKKEKEAVNLYE